MDRETIWLGSMLWIEPNEPDETITSDIQGMLQQGLPMARLLVLPCTLRYGRDQWDFSTWDRVFTIGEKLGMKFTVTLSSLGSEAWLEEEWGSQPKDLRWYHASREVVCETARKTVERYKHSSALHSWILQNAPSQGLEPNAWTLPLFREWIPSRYGWDARALRDAYCTPTPLNGVETMPRGGADRDACIACAGTIGTVRPDGTGYLPGVSDTLWSYNARVDWAAFMEEMLCRHLTEVRDAVKAEDPEHPVTINPDSLATISPNGGGRSLFPLGRTVDFLGCSCHVSWHSARFPRDRIHDSVAMFCDEIRSATADPEGYFWITELQSGTNFFSGNRPMCPTGADMTRWLWEAIGAGCRGMIYWLYKARPNGFEGLEWGLMNQRGGESHRSRASKAVYNTLTANRELFAHTKPAPYDGYILMSTDSAVLSAAENPFAGLRSSDKTDPRNLQMIQDGWCGAYCMLRDLGYNVGFADGAVFDGKLPEGSFLIVPNAYAMDEKTAAAIARYAREGGTVIADGLMAVKDIWGRKSGTATQKALEELWGNPMEDWGVDTEPFDFETTDGKLPGWFLSGAFTETEDMEVLARGPEGDAAFISRPVGKGKAICLSTLFFQSRFALGDTLGYSAFLRKLLPARKGHFVLETPSPDCVMRRLESPNGDVLVLMGGSEAQIAVISGRDAVLHDLLDGTEYLLSGSVKIPLAPGQVRVLREK